MLKTVNIHFYHVKLMLSRQFICQTHVISFNKRVNIRKIVVITLLLILQQNKLYLYILLLNK